MKIYMREYTLDTSLLFSAEGRVLGVYLDSEDAQLNFDALPENDATLSKRGISTEESEGEMALDFDNAA